MFCCTEQLPIVQLHAHAWCRKSQECNLRRGSNAWSHQPGIPFLNCEQPLVLHLQSAEHQNLLMMQKRLSVEYERWQQYLDTPTRKPLISIVEQQLLAAHMPSILEKGFDDLMTQKRSVVQICFTVE